MRLLDEFREQLYTTQSATSGFCKHRADVSDGNMDDCSQCFEEALALFMQEKLGIAQATEDFVDYPLTIVGVEIGRDRRDSFTARSDSGVAEARFVMLEDQDKPVTVRSKVLMRIYFDE